MIHFSYLGHNYISLVHRCGLLFCHLCISQAYYITKLEASSGSLEMELAQFAKMKAFLL